MTVLAYAVAGFVLGGGAWIVLATPFRHPALQRENYQGVMLPTALGVAAVLGFVAVLAAAGVLDALGWLDDPVAEASRSLTLPAVVGYALLGLFDDLAGSGHHRGFGGHARELAHGHLTTGMFKLAGGALIALAVVAGIPHTPQIGWLLVDAALVALAANFANLLDRAPGRTTKVALVALAALALATRRWSELAGPAAATGAAAGLLPAELGERGMLGDTGANAVGGALGLAVVLSCPHAAARGRAGGAARREPAERAGQLQRGHRRLWPAALARPPRSQSDLMSRREAT